MSDHMWKLTVRFGYDYTDVSPSPTGIEEARMFAARLLEDWAMETDDLDDDELVLDADTVTVTVDVLDYLATAMRDATGRHIPKKMLLERID